MGISNELSSEIAAAILIAAKDSPRKLEALKLVLEQVHDTLVQIEQEDKRPRAKAKAASTISDG